MERLTYDFVVGENHCWQIHGADNELCEDVCKRYSESGCKNCPIGHAFDRLAAYEDIGLEPEEIVAAENLKHNCKIECLLKKYNELSDMIKELGPINHLRGLVQAEKDGRVVVLDDKLLLSILAGARAIENNRKLFGATYCWDICGKCGGPKKISYYKAAKLLREMVEPILTREEAEAALKGGTE